MKIVTVYNYEGFSVVDGKTINHGTYATMQFITKARQTPRLDRTLDVQMASLNSDEQYVDSPNNKVVVVSEFIEPGTARDRGQVSIPFALGTR